MNSTSKLYLPFIELAVSAYPTTILVKVEENPQTFASRFREAVRDYLTDPTSLSEHCSQYLSSCKLHVYLRKGKVYIGPKPPPPQQGISANEIVDVFNIIDPTEDEFKILCRMAGQRRLSAPIRLKYISLPKYDIVLLSANYDVVLTELDTLTFILT